MSNEWIRIGTSQAGQERERRGSRLGAVVLVVAVVLATVMLTGCAGEWFAMNQPKEEASERPDSASTSASDSAATAPAGPQVTVLDTGNTLGIRQGGSAPSFTLDKPATLSIFTTYHYIDGGGPAPGTLALTGSDGKTYGPWQTKGIDGQGGVANAFWEARPNVKLPAGTYKVVDSDPGTWSTNDKAKGIGFTTVVVVYE
jgi:hypothetical protein